MPDEVARRAPGWIVRQLRTVLRAKWEDVRTQISIVELGVNRALAAAFGAKVEPLPDYANIRRKSLPRDRRLPAWMLEYERVNADRIQCG